MKRYIVAWAAMAALCAVMDAVWIGGIAHRLYIDQIGTLLYLQPRAVPAAAFYMLYLSGVAVFVVAPAARAQAWSVAVRGGMLFGLVAYGAYDLTNLATLKGFTLTIAAVDMAWGALLTALCAYVGYRIVERPR